MKPENYRFSAYVALYFWKNTAKTSNFREALPACLGKLNVQYLVVWLQGFLFQWLMLGGSTLILRVIILVSNQLLTKKWKCSDSLKYSYKYVLNVNSLAYNLRICRNIILQSMEGLSNCSDPLSDCEASQLSNSQSQLLSDPDFDPIGCKTSDSSFSSDNSQVTIML